MEQTLGFILKKAADFRLSTVECHNSETMICDVQYEILAHHGQTDEAEISTGVDPRMSADVYAGKTGAIVSPLIQSEQGNLFNAGGEA